MKPSLTRVRVLAANGFLILSLAFLPALPAAAERPSNAGQLFFWLLGLNMAREQGTPWKIDVNSATVDELGAVPGIERRQALRIIAQRPYAKLRDLVRAGVSPHLIERLAAFLTVDPDWPSALPRPSTVPHRR
jgi:hypothetical protein